MTRRDLADIALEVLFPATLAEIAALLLLAWAGIAWAAIYATN